jgi:hypothetical protein
MIDDRLPKLIVTTDHLIKEAEVRSTGRAYDGRGVPEYVTLFAARRFDDRM